MGGDWLKNRDKVLVIHMTGEVLQAMECLQILLYNIKMLSLPLKGDKTFHCEYIKWFKKLKVDDFALPVLISLTTRIDKMRESNHIAQNLTITKFLRSITENHGLYQKLKDLNDLSKSCDGMSYSTNYADFHSKLSEVVENFELLDLERKIRFLQYSKMQVSIADMKRSSNWWNFYCQISNPYFWREYINQAVAEESKSFNESFHKEINECIKSAEQGKQVASKYFNEKGTNFQAYCEESDDTGRVLNVNLIDYDKSKPIKISDILQQEKNIGKLNIYCNKKHEVHAHQNKDKKRYYVFEKGAHYEMTSTWPVEDESGNISTCTMVMNVSSDGITKILKFNGEDYTLLSEEDKKLIEKNEEFFIEGLPLCEAVGKFLGLQRGSGCGEDIIPIGESGAKLPDVTTITNSSSQGANQNKEPDEKSKGKDLEDDAGSSPSPSSTNSNASMSNGDTMQQLENNLIFIECMEGIEDCDSCDSGYQGNHISSTHSTDERILGNWRLFKVINSRPISHSRTKVSERRKRDLENRGRNSIICSKI